jgi:hypothetical protein
MAKNDKEKDKKDESKDPRKSPDIQTSKEEIKLNELFQELYKKISINTHEVDVTKNQSSIDAMSEKIKRVIAEDMDEMKTFGGENDISRFLMNTIQNSNKFNISSDLKNIDTGLESIFLSGDGAIFSTFEERFKNKALLFNDLEIISEQLVELNEAINTTRDDIVSSDDVGSEIARSLTFSVDGVDDDKYDELVDEVKKQETIHSLNYIIREHIVPKTLKYGEYYVYVIPESKLYENAQKRKMELTNGAAMESVDAKAFLESLNLDKTDPKYRDVKPDDMVSYISENVKINNTDIPLPLLENKNLPGAMQDLADFNNLTNMLKKAKGKKNDKTNGENKYSALGFSDGVKSFKMDDWSGVKGCYIKLLNPKKVIPVKLMNYTIGYYYIHDAELDVTNHHCAHGHRFTNVVDSMTNKSANQQNLIANIADAIVKSFDKKYLNDNIEFKELIINSLMYNDMYKKKLHYQFIPGDHICRFSINEDENGNGQSMLYKSLFYAKLYLSLLVFNMITYLTKSQDTLVTYVKTSGIDKNMINKTMDVARQWKSKQIGIGDLMDYSSIYSKIGTGRDLFIPEGESGERGLSWDVIQGQDVNMQNELMEQLKEAYINGTGVPSVIMNYVNEADFAKTLVMANAKQLRRVMMYQDSFNEDLTLMYQKILCYCTDIELEDIANFRYTLQRPKTLPNNNLVDMIGYGDQILDFVEKSIFGQYTEETPELNASKDMFRNEFSRKVLPMLPWETIDEIIDRVKLDVVKNQIAKSNNQDNSEGGY